MGQRRNQLQEGAVN